MTALDRIKRVKDMFFYEDNRSIEEFIGSWEEHLWGDRAKDIPIEIRAFMLMDSFHAMGMIEHTKDIEVGV